MAIKANVFCLCFIGFLWASLLNMFFPPVTVAAQLTINSQKGAPGQMVTLAVSVINAPDTVKAFIMDIGYNPDVLSYSGYEKGGITSKGYVLFDVNRLAPGIVRVGGVAPLDPGIQAGASGTIVRLRFNVIGAGETSVYFKVLKDDIKGWSTTPGHFVSLSNSLEEDAKSASPGDKASKEAAESADLKSQTDNLANGGVAAAVGAKAQMMSQAGRAGDVYPGTVDSDRERNAQTIGRFLAAHSDPADNGRIQTGVHSPMSFKPLAEKASVRQSQHFSSIQESKMMKTAGQNPAAAGEVTQNLMRETCDQRQPAGRGASPVKAGGDRLMIFSLILQAGMLILLVLIYRRLVLPEGRDNLPAVASKQAEQDRSAL